MLLFDIADQFQEVLCPTTVVVVSGHSFDFGKVFQILGALVSDPEEGIVGENTKGSAIAASGFVLAVKIKRFENALACGIERPGPVDLYEAFRPKRLCLSLLLARPCEGLTRGVPELPGLQILRQPVPQIDEVVRVHAGVIQLFFFEGAFSPVVPLPFLVEDDSEVLLDKLGQTQLGVSQQLGGLRRIEKIPEGKSKIAFEPQDVVYRRMEDFFYIRVVEYLAQWLQIFQLQRVQDIIVLCRGDLYEADPFEVGVKTVGFRIDGNVPRGGQLLHELQKVCRVLYDDHWVHSGVPVGFSWGSHASHKRGKPMGNRKKKMHPPPSRSSRGKSFPLEFYTPFKGLDQHLTQTSHTASRRDQTPSRGPVSASPQDDDQLFTEAMKDVVPLADAGKKRVPPPSPAKRAPRFLAQEEQEVFTHLVDLVSGGGEFELTYSDEYVDGAIVGLSPKILKKLRRGEFSYQDYIDLHGLTRDQARDEVIRFVQESFARKSRCILVVSGRGLNSRDKQPVLKKGLVHWLTRSPLKRLILAFASARTYDGGAGAFYVLLRRNEGKAPFVTPAV